MAKKKQTKPVKLDRTKKMLWQSMRIFKGNFTVPLLLQSTPGATFPGAARWVGDLERHGIITKVGGIPAEGQHQRYRMVSKRETVIYPMICTICGNMLYRKCFFFKPGKKKEREKERGEPRVVDGKARVAEMVGTVQRHYGLPLPEAPAEPRHKVPADLKQRLEQAERRRRGEIHHDAA